MKPWVKVLLINLLFEVNRACMIFAFIWEFLDEYVHGHGIGMAIFGGVFASITAAVCVLGVGVLYWRLFTPSGREAERIAQERTDLRRYKRRQRWRRWLNGE